MNKETAERLFRESFPEVIASNDKPLKREAWNNFTDMLCKDGEITERQYNTWTHPKFLKV